MRLAIPSGYPLSFLFLLYHFGDVEDELCCKDLLEEPKLDENELPSVEEPELAEFRLILLLLTF